MNATLGGEDVCGIRNYQNGLTVNTTTDAVPTKSQDVPENGGLVSISSAVRERKYSHKEKRLESFKHWPRSLNQRPKGGIQTMIHGRNTLAGFRNVPS